MRVSYVIDMRHFLAIALVAVGFSACTQPAAPPAPSASGQAAPAAASGAPAGRDPLPGTKLTIDQLRQQMFHVSAGRRLKPTSWPNGARVAVGLSFDVDNATATLSTGNLDYEVISRGEYGAVDGLPRILRLLSRQQVPASFFIPAVSALLHPQMVKDIQAASAAHEIGVHGWIHERLPLVNDEKEEQRMLNQSIETLTMMTGKRPVGYRAPSWKFSGWTMGQVKAAGFLYDSSLMASDDAYELLLDGTADRHRGAADRAHPGRLPRTSAATPTDRTPRWGTCTRSSSPSSTWPTRKAVCTF